MSIFRSDLYVTLKITDFNLEKSSKEFFQLLSKVADLRNLQMTKVTRDREIQGKIKIEEWFEITVKNVGRLTSKIMELQVGNELLVRGPYGNFWPIESMKGEPVFAIACRENLGEKMNWE